MRETMYSCLHSSKVEMLRVSPIVQESQLRMGQSSTSYFVSRNPKLFYIEVQLLKDTRDQVYWLRTYVTSTDNTSANVKINSNSLINSNLNYLSVEFTILVLQIILCLEELQKALPWPSRPPYHWVHFREANHLLMLQWFSLIQHLILENMLSCKPRVIKKCTITT